MPMKGGYTASYNTEKMDSGVGYGFEGEPYQMKKCMNDGEMTSAPCVPDHEVMMKSNKMKGKMGY